MASTLGDPSAEAVGNAVQTFLEPIYLEIFSGHRLGLHDPAMESGFDFCQQHLELPICLLSKYYTGPMLLSFSV